VTRRLKLESRDFHIKVAYKVLTFSMVSLPAKSEEILLIGELKLGWDCFRLRDAVSRKDARSSLGDN